MADVRSMLRAERAARAPPKAAPRNQPTAPQTAASQTTSKKRKAIDATHDDAKRSKFGVFVPAESDEDGDSGASQQHQSNINSTQSISAPSEHPIHSPESSSVPPITNGDVDEDEWAAFEREVATPPSPSQPRQTSLNAINSNATISAAPMTAVELEAQRKKESQQAQRVLRAEEVEAEKEDAARNLEDEFEEMEALGERVKRLKEKREKLRAGILESRDSIDIDPSDEGASTAEAADEADEEEEDDDDEYGDEWDTLGFPRP